MNELLDEFGITSREFEAALALGATTGRIIGYLEALRRRHPPDSARSQRDPAVTQEWERFLVLLRQPATRSKPRPNLARNKVNPAHLASPPALGENPTARETRATLTWPMALKDAEARLKQARVIETDQALNVLLPGAPGLTLYRLERRDNESASLMRDRVIQAVAKRDPRTTHAISEIIERDGQLLARLAGATKRSWRRLGATKHVWRAHAVEHSQSAIDPTWQRAREAAAKNRPLPVASQLRWEVLPRGWWRLPEHGRDHSVNQQRSPKYVLDRVTFVDSLSPLEWYRGSHLGSVIYYVAVFPTVAIADALEDGNAIYYVRTDGGRDWRAVLRLTKQEARLAGAKRLVHRGDWQGRVAAIAASRAAREPTIGRSSQTTRRSLLDGWKLQR